MPGHTHPKPGTQLLGRASPAAPRVRASLKNTDDQGRACEPAALCPLGRVLRKGPQGQEWRRAGLL